jgi:hypothetical protein
MTDPSAPGGRVDLRAIDPPDPERVERVVGAVARRIAALPPRPARVGALEAVSACARPALAAALVCAVAAGLVLATQRRPHHDRSLAALSDWARESHAPTNGELLAAFAGYTQ